VKVFGYASTAGTVLSGVFTALKIAIMSNPIMAIITALAAAAGLIIYYWEPIKTFFIDLWDGIVKIFDESMKWINEQIALAAKGYEELMMQFMTDEQKTMYLEMRDKRDAQKKASEAVTAKGMDWAQTVAPGNETDALVKELGRIFTTPAAAAVAPAPAANAAPSEGVAQGAPLMNPDQAGAMASSRFDGRLEIKIDAEGKPTAEMKQTGDPAFEVRMNRGNQAA